MGELADDFRFMKEQAKKRREKIEPSRFDYVSEVLVTKGKCYISSYIPHEKCINFETENGTRGKIYPYKGWWSGKGIGSGRGIKQLIKKLRSIEDGQ